MATYEKTINWETYWNEADESDREKADASSVHIVRPLIEFFEARGSPSSYADVGCGPASTVFELADRYPESTAIGYDAAKQVLDSNRAYADQEGYGNISFESTVLPEFDPHEEFEVVSSFFTLCYIPEIEQAIENLYDAVEPGGYLVFTYHNEYAQSIFSGMAKQPHEHLPEDGVWDPDHFAERFEGVIEGETLLSYRKIHDILGAWPQSVWSVVDTERYGAWKQNPLVFVPKT